MTQGALLPPFVYGEMGFIPGLDIQVLTARGVELVDQRTLCQFLPGVVDTVRTYGHLDPRMLVDKLWSSLQLVHLPQRHVEHVFNFLFQILCDNAGTVEQTRLSLLRYLERTMKKDVRLGLNHAGLIRCRRSFLALAVLSHAEHSRKLGAVLVNFFSANHNKICQLESRKGLVQWGVAITYISGLISPGDLENCLRSFVPYYRDVRLGYRTMLYPNSKADEFMGILRTVMGMEEYDSDDDYYDSDFGGRGRGRRRDLRIFRDRRDDRALGRFRGYNDFCMPPMGLTCPGEVVAPRGHNLVQAVHPMDPIVLDMTENILGLSEMTEQLEHRIENLEMECAGGPGALYGPHAFLAA